MKTVISKVENGGDVTLTTLAKYKGGLLLPTPRANDMNHSTRIEQPSFQHRFHRDYMAEVVIASTNPKHGQTSQLNPRFVAEMMGFPSDWTESPFQSGETNPSRDTEMR
jgi:hypothetical protein